MKTVRQTDMGLFCKVVQSGAYELFLGVSAEEKKSQNFNSYSLDHNIEHNIVIISLIT